MCSLTWIVNPQTFVKVIHFYLNFSEMEKIKPVYAPKDFFEVGVTTYFKLNFFIEYRLYIYI